MNIGDRLKIARRMAGLSLRDLSAEADVSAMAISKYENGQDVPGSAVLIRLSRALGVRVEYLLRPATVAITAGPLYRRRASLPVKEQEQIMAKTQEWIERRLDAESLFGAAPHFTLPEQIDRCVARLSDVERIAIDLRQAWDLGVDSIENLIEVLEERGIWVCQLAAHQDFDALTLWANDTIPVIVVKEGVPGDRQRFNLAHELSHLIMDLADGVDENQAANRFAGAFLVPRPTALREIGNSRHVLAPMELHLLKHKYGISMQAWVHRAADLGVISPSAMRVMFQQFSRVGWRMTEPGDPIPAESSDRLGRLVLRAVAEDVISPARASELLGMPLSSYQQMEAERHGNTLLASLRS